MPTVLIRCKPQWSLSKRKLKLTTAATMLSIARWLPTVVAEAVNEIDELSVDDSSRVNETQVEVDFGQINSLAINTADVVIVVNPPEIDADFKTRLARRAALRDAIKDKLWQLMLGECDVLIYPEHWEVEVVPVEASGYGLNARGEVSYSWGNSATS